MTPQRPTPHVSRRQFLGTTISAAAVAAACGGTSPTTPSREGRLVVNPIAPTGSIEPGDTALNLGARDARLYVPPSYDPTRPMPLVLGFHGAGGSGNGWLNATRVEADEHGFVILAPDSREQTWDALRGRFGPDIDFVNEALEATFTRVNIDSTRMAIAGFSDGATYALSVGLANGDYFQKTIAFSPGFVVDATPHGQPMIFISHGTLDTVLPIDNCSRRIVPALRSGGYDVTYREFGGGHRIDEQKREEAFVWMLA